MIIKERKIQTLPSRTLFREGQSLFSYLLKTAYNNGISIAALLNMIRKNEKYLLHKRDIRRIDYYPESVFDLKKLIELTGLTQSNVYESSFTNVLHVFGYYNHAENARLMKNMIRENLHYCTKCLEEGLGYKLVWKVTGVDCCLVHNQSLLNGCLHCKQEIGYHDIITTDRCPHCNQSLIGILQDNLGQIENKAIQQSYQTNINQLIRGTDLQFNSQEIAQKLLYLMNKLQPVYQASIIRESLQGYSITHLLQHARDTMSTSRNIKLSFVLEVLNSHSVDIKRLSTMDVPTSFVHSLLEGKSISWTREFVCKAPWCKVRGKQNSLVPTSSKHVIKSGAKFSHYLVCRGCYCEYAFDVKKNFVERTQFISAFAIMTKENISKMNWPEKIKCFSMNKESIRRAIAYFCARQLLKEEILNRENNTDNLLLNKFISALRRGDSISDIRYSTLWKNYDQYLLHRYDPVVMKEIFDTRYVENSGC
ncbi:TniQ family protein [Paenibacillus taichungensis]